MVCNNYSWVDKENEQKMASLEVDKFFMDLIGGKVVSPKGTRITYRSGQNEYATSVMNAIKNNQILLIEAGVGIGKSFGYLIPVFYSYKNVQVFDKVIISTSSRTLGEQLVEDVKNLSSMLGIEIKAEVSKGMNNYACIENINKVLENAKKHNDTNIIEILESLKKRIRETASSDKADLGDIPPYLWSSIQVSGCADCRRKDSCEYNRHQESIKDANIIITNHVQLGNLVDNKWNEINPDAVFIDEAHNLEEQIRLSKEQVFSVKKVFRLLDRIEDIIDSRSQSEVFYVKGEFSKAKSNTITALTNFIKTLRSNAIYNYKKENDDNNYQNTQKLTIRLESEPVKDSLSILIKSMAPLFKCLTELSDIREIYSYSMYLMKYVKILLDMAKNRLSENVYWVKFSNNYNIDIVYTPKNISSTLDKLFKGKKPVILTSGTLTTDKTYDKIKSSLLIGDDKRVIEHESIPSPYDYENNSLFYYDPSIVSPKTPDKDKYIESIASKVEELIRITEGKALVLFTSKADMRRVYDIVNSRGLTQKLLIQDDFNSKEEFKNDVNSCLFATGSFWEGVDFSGETLSNLIIVRLPFPVMDPIVEYKKEGKSRIDVYKLTKEEMLMKLAQGTGRLIRCASDKGIICCLDSRFSEYSESIVNTLPFVNYTDNIDEVKRFSDANILNKSKTFILK